MIGLGGSSTLGIGLIIELRDKFTQNANKISSSMNKLHGNAEKAMKSSFNSMIGAGATMAGVGLAITRGVSAAVKESMQFEQVLLNVKALGEMSNVEMLELGKIAKTLGPKYGRDAITVAKGMEDLVKAGLKGKDIPKVMEAIMQAATASGDALEGEGGVAARMTDMMMAWGINANQAQRMGDVLTKASIESTVSFNDLAESMKYSQDIFKGLHMTFEESVAMMGVLGNAGIKASMSGTALGNAWREMSIALGGGSKKKNSALKLLGIDRADMMDAYGNLKRPLEILDKIKEGVRGMGDVQRQNVLNDLFGVRGKRGVNPLLDFLSRGGNDKFMGKLLKEMVDALTNESAGSNMKIIEEKMKGAAFQSEQLKSNWVNFKIAIGNAVLPVLGAIVRLLNKILPKLTAFAETGFGKWLIRGIVLLGLVLIPLGAMVTLTGLIGRGMMSISGGFAAFKAAGLWAWNTLIARALTYLGIMKGIEAHQGINAAGSIFDKRTGRIIKTAAKRGLRGRGILGWLNKISPLLGRFGGWISKIIPSLSSLLPVVGKLVRVFSIVGAISMFLSMIGISFKNQVLYVFGTIKWVVGSIVNAIMGILEWIPGVDFGGGGWSERQDSIREASYGGIKTPYEEKDWSKFSNQNSPYPNRNYSLPKMGNRETIVNIHVDGEKTISKRINEGQENELSSRYGLNQ